MEIIGLQFIFILTQIVQEIFSSLNLYGNTKYVNFSIKGGGLLGIHLPKITTLSLNNCVKCNFDILHT